MKKLFILLLASHVFADCLSDSNAMIDTLMNQGSYSNSYIQVMQLDEDTGSSVNSKCFSGCGYISFSTHQWISGATCYWTVDNIYQTINVLPSGKIHKIHKHVNKK